MHYKDAATDPVLWSLSRCSTCLLPRTRAPQHLDMIHPPRSRTTHIVLHVHLSVPIMVERLAADTET